MRPPRRAYLLPDRKSEKAKFWKYQRAFDIIDALTEKFGAKCVTENYLIKDEDGKPAFINLLADANMLLTNEGFELEYQYLMSAIKECDTLDEYQTQMRGTYKIAPQWNDQKYKNGVLW